MEVRVSKDRIKISAEIIHKGEYKINYLDFTFTQEYTDLSKMAVFTKDETSYSVPIIDDKCHIPNEVLTDKGTIIFGVYAYEIENDEVIKRYSPAPVKLEINPGSYEKNAITPIDVVEPSEFDELIEELNNKQDKLTAGDNITIDENNVISATGGGTVDLFYTELTEDIVLTNTAPDIAEGYYYTGDYSIYYTTGGGGQSGIFQNILVKYEKYGYDAKPTFYVQTRDTSILSFYYLDNGTWEQSITNIQNSVSSNSTNVPTQKAVYNFVNRVTSISSNSTDTETPTAKAVYDVARRDVLALSNIAQTVIPSTHVYYTIQNFTPIVSIGDKLTMSVVTGTENGNGIIIGAGVSIIKLYAYTGWQLVKSSEHKYMQVTLNHNDVKVLGRKYMTSSTNEEIQFEYYINVSEGDILEVQIYGTAQDTIAQNRAWFFVEVVQYSSSNSLSNNLNSTLAMNTGSLVGMGSSANLDFTDDTQLTVEDKSSGDEI